MAYLAKILSENRKDNMKFFINIPSFQINGSTLPPNVVVTNLHPDVVFIDNNTTPLTCAIYELSDSFQTNISSEKGTNSSHGNPTLKQMDSNVTLSHLNVAPVALIHNVSSYSIVKVSISIFHTRKEKNWSNPPVLIL